MANGLSDEMAAVIVTGEVYENNKAELDAEKAKKAENISMLDDVRAQLVIEQDTHDAAAEAVLAPLKEKRDKAQEKADAKHKP